MTVAELREARKVLQAAERPLSDDAKFYVVLPPLPKDLVEKYCECAGVEPTCLHMDLREWLEGLTKQ